MTRNLLETLLGAIVLVVAIGFLVFAYTRSQVETGDGYELVAQFDRVDGLERGAEVRVSGIRVGTVVEQELDPQTYQARVRFTVREGIELPLDTSAAIVSNSLLGGKYLQLVPGGDVEMLNPGEEITLTQSAVNLEDLIGHMVFGQGGGASEGGGGAAGGAGAPTGSPDGQ